MQKHRFCIGLAISALLWSALLSSAQLSSALLCSAHLSIGMLWCRRLLRSHWVDFDVFQLICRSNAIFIFIEIYGVKVKE